VGKSCVWTAKSGSWKINKAWGVILVEIGIIPNVKILPKRFLSSCKIMLMNRLYNGAVRSV
jgi:hypothetical protein